MKPKIQLKKDKYESLTFLGPLIKKTIMDGFKCLRCLWKHLDKILYSIMLRMKNINITKKRLNLICDIVQTLNKIANNGRIKILRCLRKGLDKKILCIPLKFLKTQNLTQKRHPKSFKIHFLNLRHKIWAI